MWIESEAVKFYKSKGVKVMLKEGDIIIRENGNEEEVIRILKSHAATVDLKTNQRYKKKFLVIDLDGTLIQTATGGTFPKGIWDMKLDLDVLEAISNLNPEYILIATNQGGIEKGFVNRWNFEAKLEFVRRCVAEYTGCENVWADYTEVNDEDNYYRKPNPGMFDERFESLEESGVGKDDCLMVGDASGNPGDFSDSDKKFAENCGIEYMDVKHFVDLYKKYKNK